jgi:hypothetical protein
MTADCSTTTRPRARKEHTCDECWAPIRAGEVYVRITGVWDGTPGSFSLHPECDEFSRAFEGHIRDSQAAEMEARRTAPIGVRVRCVYDHMCDCVAIGELREALAEFCVEVHGYHPRDPEQPPTAGGGAL